MKSEKNGDSQKFELTAFVITFGGKQYRIDTRKVIQAFERAEVGGVKGSHARYYIRIGGDMKPVEDVFVSIVPMKKDDIKPDAAEIISNALIALGFEILDRHRHHECG